MLKELLCPHMYACFVFVLIYGCVCVSEYVLPYHVIAKKKKIKYTGTYRYNKTERKKGRKKEREKERERERDRER